MRRPIGKRANFGGARDARRALLCQLAETAWYETAPFLKLDPRSTPEDQVVVYIEPDGSSSSWLARTLMTVEGRDEQSVREVMAEAVSVFCIVDRATLVRLLRDRIFDGTDGDGSRESLHRAPPHGFISFVAVCDWNDTLLLAALDVRAPRRDVHGRITVTRPS